MKIRVLLAIMCLLFASCEKENSGSLTGTTWIQYDEYSDGHRSEYKMTFTSTDVTYTVSDQDGTHTGLNPFAFFRSFLKCLFSKETIICFEGFVLRQSFHMSLKELGSFVIFC